jgi:Protein kinase domain
MTFTRCLVGETDTHVSPTTAVTTRPQSATTSTMLPALLHGWSRKKSTPESPEQEENSINNNQHESLDTHTVNVPSPPPHVVYRRGEKSFLEFHQHYAITRHLGEGSYSTVKQVTHRTKGGLYACKIVDKAALSAVDRIALGHEISVLSSIQHEHIMRLYEVIEDDTKCYLIMELAEHGDLFDKIVKQGKFAIVDAQQVVSALVEALVYCHAHAVIHRDVKPENVLLMADHNIKLCDFGFAKQLKDVNETSIDSCPGDASASSSTSSA